MHCRELQAHDSISLRALAVRFPLSPWGTVDGALKSPDSGCLTITMIGSCHKTMWQQANRRHWSQLPCPGSLPPLSLLQLLQALSSGEMHAKVWAGERGRTEFQQKNFLKITFCGQNMCCGFHEFQDSFPLLSLKDITRLLASC